ncbi:MAG TPA: aldo/keto reductase [Steroidobacteraceae bacterium]|jgi:aryl-alcohol dehydrogenase-like predicted oxidoreductase|nr:aldo/keto reductase [Steroidobacteraceae bacterium]
MQFTEFGTTGIRVSEIGFGGSRIGGVFADKNSRNQAIAVLCKALDSGITFYDTANIYSQGESESLIGTAFRGRRDQVILATKGGFCLPARRNMIRLIKPLVRPIVRALGLKRAQLPAGLSGKLAQDFSASQLTKALEGSLKRLRTDYIDLYQLHSPSVPFMQSANFGESLETLEKLKVQGKLRFYGVATEAPEDVPFCLSAPGISSIQLGFGLLDPEALDQGMLAAAEARGLGIIARGCFAGGLLKDGLNEAQLKASTPKWPRILALRSLSKTMGRPVLDLAYQFCRSTPAIGINLLGMRVEDHLRQNLYYYDSPPLSAEEYLALCHLQEIKDEIMA